jgi:hypothetical protein
MVKTVSDVGFVVASTAALATEAPGSEASAIQSSGMTKRAKTFPLSPLPLSSDGDTTDLAAGTGALLSIEATTDEAAPPEEATVVGRESV